LKRIEIKTSDQVIIVFDIAGLRDRAFSFLIDFLILFGIIFVLSTIHGMINPTGKYFYYLVILPLFLFYTLVFEIITGGLTPGKKAMNLRVIKLNGQYATPMDYIIRWLFRWLDIWMSIFVIGSAFINSSRYGQRLGDMMAGTTVIKFQSKQTVSLNEILNIESQKQYTPKYPQVTLLNDKDMLLVKNTIKRAQAFNNEAHRKIIARLIVQLKTELKIDGEIKDNENFLKTLLKDYVVLTR
jgi:uncharacterized RDD family membrane protein YckC